MSFHIVPMDHAEQWGGIEAFPVPVLDCQARPATSFLTSGWSVNGVEGGGGQFGTVVGDADRWTGRATYTAPTSKPERNTVSVSAQHRPLGDDTGQTLLVANITIVDGAPDCRQLRSMETLDAELSFDEFSFTATSPDSEHTGYHAGRIMGTLRKSVSSEALPFDLWITNLDSLQGLRVVIEDTHVYAPPNREGYTETFNGTGRPHEGQDGPSFIGLKVNYDTCTFDLFGSFTVRGMYARNGESREGVIGVGGLYLRNQTIPPEQIGSGFLQGSLPIGLINDVDRTGYFPYEVIGGSGRTLRGNTTARWRITASAP